MKTPNRPTIYTLVRGAAVVVLLSCVSCASQKTVRFEPGKVRHIVMDMNSRGINHFNPLWCALWLAAIGSGIGTGGTAHAIGAGGGALIGAGGGYLYESNNARRVIRIVEVESDAGVFYRLHDKDNLFLRIGQRVWIAFDKRGKPHHLAPMPSD